MANAQRNSGPVILGIGVFAAVVVAVISLAKKAESGPPGPTNYYVNDYDGLTTIIPQSEVGYFSSWWNVSGLMNQIGNFFLQATTVLNNYYNQWASLGKPGM